jgi:uncharacterized protein YndB with AHSA1/START domain
MLAQHEARSALVAPAVRTDHPFDAAVASSIGGSGAPIEQSIWIDAAPDIVFDYFVDPAKLVRWMGTRATLEASPHGVYELAFKEGWTSRGQFLVVDRPNLVVYTVGWEGNAQFPPGSTRVEITLSAERGGTRVCLRHFGPPSGGLESEGWSAYLHRLKAKAEDTAPTEDPFDDLTERA